MEEKIVSSGWRFVVGALNFVCFLENCVICPELQLRSVGV